MEELYFTGLLLAFFIGIVKVCISVAALLSIRAQNLKKIGLYYSCVSGGYLPNAKFNTGRFIVYLIYILAIAPIFSWLSVFSASWGVIAWLTNRSPVPEAVKSIQYKIAHTNLNKEQMIELQEQLSKILGVDGPIRIGAEEEKSEDYNYERNVLEFDNGYLTVNPKEKTMVFKSCTPDGDGHFHSAYEYKFEDDKLYARLTEEINDWFGKKEWDVKDGIILESELRDRDAKESIRLESVDDKIASLKQQTTWHIYDRYDVKYFVMKNHPDLFPFKKLRRLVRAEVEKMKLGSRTIKEHAARLGLKVTETEHGFKIQYPEDFPQEKREEVEQFFSEKIFNETGIRPTQMANIKVAQVELLKLLDEEVAA